MVSLQRILDEIILNIRYQAVLMFVCFYIIMFGKQVILCKPHFFPKQQLFWSITYIFFLHRNMKIDWAKAKEITDIPKIESKGKDSLTIIIILMPWSFVVWYYDTIFFYYSEV